MRVVAAGTFWNAACAPVNQRTASATSALMLSDGTIIATCRLGTDREGPDGHTGVFASRDRGETWELRSISLAERVWDGWPGETRGWYVAELRPGELTATVLWTDRSSPDRPWVNPSTQGLLGMRVYHLMSRDGGRSWTDRRRIDLRPHVGASSTGPVLGLPDGILGQPFETWKAWDDPAPGRPGAFLRLSTDGGATWVDDVLVARDPGNRIFFWDQRLETHPEDGRLVNMFWTHDVQEGRDIDVHISWASPDGRAWSYPVPTGIAGQHTQPISLGGDRLLAVYSQRQNPPGIRAIVSPDFGRSWDRSTDIEVYASDAGDEPGSGTSRAQEDYWNDMGAWQFGHPRGARLPNSEVLVVFYGGRGLVRSARWARLAV